MNGRAIAKLRRLNGWSQADLAARIGTDAVTISRWERGISNPRPSAQRRLHEVKENLTEVISLARELGAHKAEMILDREILLTQKLSNESFPMNPTHRLREVEKARREQAELKSRVRLNR
ncbi:MAG: helix-turn-helix domain-containing protein [Actinomycetota bacterium]